MNAAAPGPAKAGTIVLVGCGQMGSAMLRGWLAGSAAAQFAVVEPAGLPAAFSGNPSISFCRTAAEIDGEPAPDAVVFAVKPQIIDEVLPAYLRWAGPQTLFLSIAAGKTIAGLARHLGEAAIARVMPNTPALVRKGASAYAAGASATERPRIGSERP